MTENKHTVATDALATLGYIIDETARRDAIHLAVEPVIAGETLFAGQHVGPIKRPEPGPERYYGIATNTVGIVDPFLRGPVQKGQRFWLVLYPRQITSLRHVWEHPAFPPATLVPDGMVAVPEDMFRDMTQVVAGMDPEIKGIKATHVFIDELEPHPLSHPENVVGFDIAITPDSTHIVASEKDKAASEKWLRDYAEQIDETFNRLLIAAKNYVDHEEYYYGAEEHGYHGKFEGTSTPPLFWDHYQIYTGEYVPEEKRNNFFSCSC